MFVISIISLYGGLLCGGSLYRGSVPYIFTAAVARIKNFVRYIETSLNGGSLNRGSMELSISARADKASCAVGH